MWNVGIRRIPLQAAGGAEVRLAKPEDKGVGADGWSMIRATSSADRAVGDSTLTMVVQESNAEAAVATTADRLIGLLFKFNGVIYRITDQDGAAGLTFVQHYAGSGGLLHAMTAETRTFKIQADLPPLARRVLLNTTTDSIRVSELSGGTATANGAYITILSGMNWPIVDSGDPSIAAPTNPLFLTSDGAGTTTLELAIRTS